METKEIMRGILIEDKNVLSRRDDFIKILENSSPNPKDFAAIKRAVQSVNIAEMFLANDLKDAKDKEDCVKSAREKLVNIGMQDARIDFVIDAFTYALNWNFENASELPVAADFLALNEDENLTPERENILEKITQHKAGWTCSCGKENDGAFCTVCGKKRQSVEEKSYEKSIAESVEKTLEETKIPANIVGQNGILTKHPEVVTTIQPKNNVEHLQNINPSNSPHYYEDTRNQYFAFHGRMNRWAFFIMGLKSLGWFLAVCIIASILGKAFSEDLMVVTILLSFVVLFFCSMSLSVRRWHDVNKSGWWQLLMFVPYVNMIIGLYLAFAPGTDGANEYGADPLQM